MRVDKSVIVLFRQMNLFLNRELLDEKLTSSDVLYLALLYEQDGRTQDEMADDLADALFEGMSEEEVKAFMEQVEAMGQRARRLNQRQERLKAKGIDK